MPVRPRRTSAAIASLRINDVVDEIESYSSGSESEPPAPPRRRASASAAAAAKPRTKQPARRPQTAPPRPAARPKAARPSRPSRPARAAVVLTVEPDLNSQASQSSLLRSRLVPFIETFADNEQDRVRPGKRSICYLDDEDEARGKKARMELVEDQEEFRVGGRKKSKKKKRPTKKEEERYTPLTIVTTGRRTSSKAKARAKRAAAAQEYMSSSSFSSSSASSVESSISPPLGPFDRKRLQASRNKIRRAVAPKTAHKLSFSSPERTASTTQKKKKKKKNERDASDSLSFSSSSSSSAVSEVPLPHTPPSAPPVLRRSAAYHDAESSDDSLSSDVSYANAREARSRLALTKSPRAGSANRRKLPR